MGQALSVQPLAALPVHCFMFVVEDAFGSGCHTHCLLPGLTTTIRSKGLSPLETALVSFSSRQQEGKTAHYHMSKGTMLQPCPPATLPRS